MTTIDDVQTFDFNEVPIDPLWNFTGERELKIHQIHAYPAKFPAFVTTKAIEYAHEKNLQVKTIADIFCGCGTTAFEARRNNIDYWGCDVNPVATLIAQTKSRKYQIGRLQTYYEAIAANFKKRKIPGCYGKGNKRLKYWYSRDQYNKLAHLKTLIINNTPPNSDYQRFFLCAFSNILKPASRWLTKSIKPQIDPDKQPVDVYTLFAMQWDKMLVAIKEIQELSVAKNTIITGNFLDNSLNFPEADIIVTSPPYVTSYEYADLHQLSTLWLDYVDDYRILREGTIGSRHHNYDFNNDKNELNETGKMIVDTLFEKEKGKARAVAKYFLDMQKVANKTYSIVKNNGFVLFVIGNTEYKGVIIDNAKHLAESLKNAGYKEISASKRKISRKILTPYRDKNGKFTCDSEGRKIYSEEFILIGKK
jgi:methylase of polypeptide subunit release factors